MDDTTEDFAGITPNYAPRMAYSIPEPLSTTNTLVGGLIPPPAYSNTSTPYYASIGSGGGGGGAVDSVSAGAGLVVSPTTGAVVVSMPNVGTSGAVSNPASITTDAQGRVSSITSLGYTPVNPTALSAYAPLAGATFTGAVSGIAPTDDANLTTKLYVDNAVAGGGSGVYLPLAGGTMTGDINMSGNELTFVSKISNATGDLDLSGNDVNIRQLDAGTEELPNVLNITSAGATAIASGGAITCSAVGAVNLTSGLSTTIFSTAGTVKIGGPINNITVESNGTTVSGVSDLIASGEISAQSLDISAGALVGGGLQASTLSATNGITATGNVNLSGASSVSVPLVPTLAGQATSKQYVDSKASTTPSPFISQVNSFTFTSPTTYTIADTDCVGGAIFLINTGSQAGGCPVLLPASSQILPVGTTVIIQCLTTNAVLVNVSEASGGGAFRNNNVYAGGSLQCVVSSVGGPTSTPPYQLTWTNGKTFNSISLDGTEVGQPVVGPVVFDTTSNIQCLDIQTGLISALDSVDFVSVEDPLQTRTLGVRSSNGTAPAEIAMALSESAVAPNILTMKYNPAGLDALEVNKDIVSNGVNLNNAIAFKDANEFFVSANGSDSTGNGSANSPYATIQKAIDIATATSTNCVINVMAGVYTENLSITKGKIMLKGDLQSTNAVGGSVIKGVITVSLSGAGNDLFNNQTVISGFLINGTISDVGDSSQHTLIIDGCRIETGSPSTRAVLVSNSATTQRTYINNSTITQISTSTSTDALISCNVGLIFITGCSLSVRVALAQVILIGGTATLSRLSESILENDSTASSLSSLLEISSTSPSAHTVALTSFVVASSTSKTISSGIAFNRSSAGVITSALLNNFFSINGTTESTNVITKNGITVPIIQVAGNRATTGTAKAIQSGSTVVPASLVGESLPDVSTWSTYPATSNVDMATYDIQNAGAIGATSLTASDFITSDTTITGLDVVATNSITGLTIDATNTLLVNSLNVKDTLDFKPTNELFVSTNGSDTTGNGSSLQPFFTIQKAVDTANLITPKSGVCVIQVSNGTYNNPIFITGANSGYIQINGQSTSQNNTFGVVINAGIYIQMNDGPSDLISRQVILSGLQLNSVISNTSSKDHTVIIQNCRFYPSADVNGMSIQDFNTATANRCLVDNCEYTNDYPSATPQPCFNFTGNTTISFSKCDIQSPNDADIFSVAGASYFQRLENCYIETQFVNPTASLVDIISTSTQFHSIALNVFSFRDSTSTTAPAILTQNGGTILLASNIFDLTGTNPTTGNAIQYSGTAPTLVYGNNSAVPFYASGIQSGINLVPLVGVGAQPIKATTITASGAITGGSLSAGSGTISTTGAITGATLTTTGAIKSSGTLQISGNVISNASNNTSITGLNSITMAGTAPSITGVNSITITNTNSTVPFTINNNTDNPAMVMGISPASTTIPLEFQFNNNVISAFGNQNTDPRGSVFLFTNGKDIFRCPTTTMKIQMNYSPYQPTLATSGTAGAFVAGATGAWVSGVPKLLGTETITLSNSNFPIIAGGFGTPYYLGINGTINTCVLNGAHNFQITATYTRTRSGTTVGPYALYGCSYPIESRSDGAFYSPLNGTTYNEAVVGERITFTHNDILAIQVYGTYVGGSPPSTSTAPTGLACVFSPFLV